MTARTIPGAAAALVLGWMGLATMNDELPADPVAGPPLRQVAVRLLGPAEEITGATVPKHVLIAKRGTEFFQIKEPCEFTVDLPGGKKVSLPVKTAFINSQVDVRTKAVVVDVDLLPLPAAVPFREAVAELRRLMCAMCIEPDERMRKQMAAWPDDLPTHPPGTNPDLPSPSYRTEVKLSGSIAFLVKVRPSDEGKYFLTLTFAVDGPARREIWDANFKPASKPPAEEKGKEPDQSSSRK